MIQKIQVIGPTWAQPLKRRLLLFQSTRQFTSWILIVSVASLVLQEIFSRLGGNQVPPDVLILATAGGAAQSLVWVLKGKMTILTSFPIPPVTLDEELHKLGYRDGEAHGKTRVFRQKLPNWLLWYESDMTVTIADGKILMEGPYFTLRKLKSRWLA